MLRSLKLQTHLFRELCSLPSHRDFKMHLIFAGYGCQISDMINLPIIILIPRKKRVDFVPKNFGRDFNSADVNLDNWRDFPYNLHTFQNVAELIPVQIIEGSENFVLPKQLDSTLLSREYRIAGKMQSGTEFLQESYTDALLIAKKGTIVSEYYENGMSLFSPHLAFSVSKSITGIVAGIVLKEFGVDADSKISSVIDGTEGGAYEEATIRNLLDMTVSVDFDESYASKEGVYARYRQAMLWMSRAEGSAYVNENLEKFILALPKGAEDHGYRFAYKSPNVDLLGLVLAKISGLPVPQLISQKLWVPAGCRSATITIDSKEMARTAGGVSCSIHDLALIGELMRRGGNINGKSVLDPAWVNDTKHDGDTEVWERGEFFDSFSKGSYRNLWYSIGEGDICAIGIHGQWIYINPAKEVVIVKLSCQPKADDDELDRKSLDFFRGICQGL